MLEIKHLTKIYKTKGGNDTKALDDVSIRFEETGLVFLLGKSGSGKSTLLNLAGGLDAPTDGEVIVMGKSSKDFTGSDFDSYRNTFVGFIFQEYNVLNEFSVEDNVALALELQGKPKDKQKIADILKSVELEQFARRKPNTLSGGQKQRIAIARALVKDPQIIMADEPTGALDSATGKQVFDTLKKLSESRLVLVVSHDREFAEVYGDRIVELADGKIISDVTKKKITPKRLDENVTLIGENTLAVKSGSALTEENFKEIKKFLSESHGSVVLTKGEKEISDFKRAARMDDDGAREHFEETDVTALEIKQYEKDRAKFIRSRLPVRKAIKIGASGLKLKPFRLILTVLLSVVAFVMFGLFSTMMVYDNDEVLMNSFMQSDYEYLALSKKYGVRVTYRYENGETYSYESNYSAKFTPREVEAIGAKTNGAFGAYSISLGNASNAVVKKDLSDYYMPSIEKLAVMNSENPFYNKLTAGAFAEKSNEICVSSYFLDCMKNADFRAVDKDGEALGTTPVEIKSGQDLVGKYLSFYGRVFLVTGVFDSGEIPAKYDSLKNGTGNYLTQSLYMGYLQGSSHTMIFVSQSFVEDNSDLLHRRDEYVQYFEGAGKQISLLDQKQTSGAEASFFNAYSVKIHSPENENVLPITYFGAEKQTLQDNEIIVPAEALSHFLPEPPNSSDYFFDEMTEEEAQEAEAKYQAAYEKWNYVWRTYDTVNNRTAVDFTENENGELIANTRPATNAEIARAKQELKTYFTERASQLVANVMLDQYELLGQFRIVGFYTYTVSYENGLYCGQLLYDSADVYKDYTIEETKYVREEDAVYAMIYVPFVKEHAAFERILDLIGKENGNPDTDVFYSLENVLYQSVEMVNDTVEVLSTAFLIVGIVLAVFASLLLFNFISMSISNKKKEIGILRAVGARGLDVFKIFFSESGIIVGICTVLSLIGSIVLTGVINNLLKADVGLDVTLFVFGWVSVAMMVGVALVVAFISTFLPVYFASRKKPVESIRAL